MSGLRTAALVASALAVTGAATAPAFATPAPATGTVHVTQVSPATRAALARTTVGHARLSLPTGWVATRRPDGLNSWCLHPRGAKTCDVTYTEAVPGVQVDTETAGGFAADPQYCGPGGGNGPLTRWATTTWGGRSAELRRWDIRCGKKSGPTVIQYVTPTYPASVLFGQTSRANATRTDALMKQIVRGSVLPKQTRPARLMDVGYVRSVKMVKGTQVFTLDRVVLDGRGKTINQARITYTYAASGKARNASLKVGRLTTVYTDGYKVLGIY